MRSETFCETKCPGRESRSSVVRCRMAGNCLASRVYGVPEYMAYTSVVNMITSWWKVMPEDVKKRITSMDK